MASEYNATTAFLQGQATQALNLAQANASRIYSLPPDVTLRDPKFKVSLTSPNIDKPPEFGDIVDTGDNSDATVQWLNKQADEWIAKYFPEINGCFKTQPEETLCGIISGVKPFGIDSTIFDLVWHQARDRAYRTVASERATLEADFASRGFTMPPGALADMSARLEDKAAVSVLDVNRDQAMKDAEIKADLLKHALSLATQLKLGVMDAMARFYNEWATLPDKDIERARIKAQATAAFYSALSSYYNVEIAFQELTLKAAQTGAGIDIDVDRNALTRQGNFSSTAGALGSAVSSFASLAGNANVAGGSLTAQIESA